MPAANDQSIGKMLDEVVKPFLADQTRLEAQLAEEEAAKAKLEKRIAQTKRDLSVISVSMIEAMRKAGKTHPLLAAAFFESENAASLAANADGDADDSEADQTADDATPARPEANVDPRRRNRPNPLLNPTG